MKDLFSLREGEIFQALKDLKDCELVIIGGYAVNAYALPRFSVDCDIVLKDGRELKKIEKILLRRGYVKVALNALEQYSGSFVRYEKTLENKFMVSMDILIGSVTDRQTGVSFQASWIFEHSAKQVLKGKTIFEELKVRIIREDALLVMKIISGRKTDIRDIFMILPAAKDKEWVRAEIEKRCDFHERLGRILDVIMSKQFKDGLSGVYGTINNQTFEKHQKAVKQLLDE